MSDWIDLGGGHRMTFTEDGEGNRIGAVLEYPCPENTEFGGVCLGSIFFDVPAVRAHFARTGEQRPVWQIVQEEPLTLTPSIRHSGVCNAHGFIRNRKWEDA